jgi:hypothetical protein
LAAAVIALSSSVVGNATEGRLKTLDIVLHLSTIGAAQADYPSHFASINKSYVVQDPGFRCERDHARLFVLEPTVDPEYRSKRDGSFYERGVATPASDDVNPY